MQLVGAEPISARCITRAGVVEPILLHRTGQCDVAVLRCTSGRLCSARRLPPAESIGHAVGPTDTDHATNRKLQFDGGWSPLRYAQRRPDPHAQFSAPVEPRFRHPVSNEILPPADMPEPACTLVLGFED